jgi:hypothetical protein
MSNMLEHTPQNGETTDGLKSVVPQNVLDIIRCAISPYPVPWSRIRNAILSEEDGNSKSILPDDLMDTAEAIKALKISRVTLHRRVREGTIPVHKLGRRNLYSLKEIREVLQVEN